MPTLILPQTPVPQPPAPPVISAPPPGPVSVIDGAIAPGQTFEALQTSAQTLSDQLTSLVTQRQGLMAELRVRGNPGHDVARGQLEQVNAQIATTTAHLANVRAQLAIRQGAATVDRRGDPAQFASRSRVIDPDLFAGLMFAMIFAVFMPISIGIARRLWRRSAKESTVPPYSDMISPRLDRLEQAVDAIAIEIERISEGQRFVTKVLAERPVSAARPSSAEGGDAAGGLGEGKPIRSLGAGPIEPIRVPDRQAVRQSITPH
jgi:hypothetical protein